MREQGRQADRDRARGVFLETLDWTGLGLRVRSVLDDRLLIYICGGAVGVLLSPLLNQLFVRCDL
jgi:hypothetical protein